MKKSAWFTAALVTSFLFSACIKEKTCKPKSVDSEIPQIQSYATNHGMNITRHESGLHYEIIDPGNGPSASPNSRIIITYTGKFMDGSTFDEQLTPNTEAWPLSALIQGWIIGIPLIQKGGHIKLLVPSSLGYGCQQYYSIPGNSVLFFDINLIDVQ